MATDDDFETHHNEYLAKQREKVKDALQDRHANKILDFVYDRHELKNEGDDDHLAASTARNYLRELRYLIQFAYDSDRFDAEPDNWDADDWNKIIRAVARDRGIGDGTKRNTCYAARAYCQWSTDSAVDDTDNINAPSISHDAIKDEDVLDASEVAALVDAAIHERDKAIISVMYEAALRRTALIQLDVRHYRTDNGWNRIYIPDRQGVKTAAGNIIPITFSAGHLDRWLTAHPNEDDPDAPLFCSIRAQDEGKRLTSHAVYTMMQRTAEHADNVNEDKVHPHILRHTRATRMRSDSRFDKSDIETVMDWASETPMHKRYTHASNRQEALTLAKAQGQEVQDEGDKLIQCPRCGSDNLPDSEYCANCTLKLQETVTDWFSHYRDIAPEDDIVVDKYEGLPTAVPPLSELQKRELDEVTKTIQKADALSFADDEELEEYEERWDVEALTNEERRDVWNDILNEIEDIYVRNYAEQPTVYRLADDGDGDINPLGLTADELEEMAKERDLM